MVFWFCEIVWLCLGLIVEFCFWVIIDGGLVIVDGGLVIIDGGLVIIDGGLVIIDGGLVITDGGLVIIDGGLVIIDGGLVNIDGGLVIIDGGLVITPWVYYFVLWLKQNFTVIELILPSEWHPYLSSLPSHITKTSQTARQKI